MKIVKLDAINSTNSFLKEMIREDKMENWTIVCTEFQTEGRGQMHAKWFSDKGKNLLFSFLVKFKEFEASRQFYLNCAVSLGIYRFLEVYEIPNISIKWPNDIMAGKKKLAGILLENTLQNNKIKHTIAGIGLNVNQESFPEDLPRAISLKAILKRDLDKDQILLDMISSIKKYIELLDRKEYERLNREYLKVLYQKGVPQMFEDKDHQRFQGIILDVSEEGRIKVQVENEIVKEFGFKEIVFL